VSRRKKIKYPPLPEGYHTRRLHDAITIYKARQAEGGEHIEILRPYVVPMPVLTDDSIDLSEYDVPAPVIPINKHPRWRWHKA
jgi:hypothetical protein